MCRANRQGYRRRFPPMTVPFPCHLQVDRLVAPTRRRKVSPGLWRKPSCIIRSFSDGACGASIRVNEEFSSLDSSASRRQSEDTEECPFAIMKGWWVPLRKSPLSSARNSRAGRRLCLPRSNVIPKYAFADISWKTQKIFLGEFDLGFFFQDDLITDHLMLFHFVRLISLQLISKFFSRCRMKRSS